MPSDYIKKILKDLQSAVGDAVESGATLEELGSESTSCKEAATVLPASKRVKVAYYKFCLTSSLRGMTPAQLLSEEDQVEEVCKLFAKKLNSTPEETEKFVRHCTTELARKRSFEEIIGEYEFF